MIAPPRCPVVMGTVRVEPGLWEIYLERGGAVFDTAYHYGAETERAVGRLVERLGIRDRITILGKGAHSPNCFPEVVASQLDESLDNLRTSHVDLYLLHRDNPDVPIAEFADVLHREVVAGRARTIGASNWTRARYEAFNDYAASHDLTPFTVLSNQLSLAEMQEPVWEGCLRADAAWHARTQTPLLAWSPQARGFFAGRPDDDELRASWITPANVERRARADELARRMNALPVTVALAWVLGQPFPVQVVVGPRDASELDACLASLDIALTDDDRRWLEAEETAG